MIWTTKDIEKATKGLINGKWIANKVSIDSRNINKGDLFIALRGNNSDGHKYIKQALDNGAAAALIDYVPDYITDFNYCLVGDTKQALSDMANYNRLRLDAKIIAITGSVGKTSTKEMLKIAFEPLGKVFASYGNYNNDLGVAISLANTEVDVEYAIYEIGMNHAGEIIPLVKMIKPDIAIITNVEPAHMEFFNSIEDIARAKAEIFTGVKKDGYAILNIDNEWYDFLVNEAKREQIQNIVNFGKDRKADIKILSYLKLSNNQSTLKVSTKSKEIEYNLNFDSEHLATASSVALAAVEIFDQNIKTSADNLINFSPPKGRGQLYKLEFQNKKITLINDSYNASPSAVKAALKSLSGKIGNRKLAIIADMKELGERSIDFHKDLLNYMDDIDKVITVGHYMSYLYEILAEDKKLSHYDNINSISKNIDQYIEDGDVILIKGSLSTEIYKLADQLISKSEEIYDI